MENRSALVSLASFFLLFSKETQDENNGNKILNNEQVWLRAFTEFQLPSKSVPTSFT